MERIQYECDVCHAVKKDENHWWNGAVDKVGNRHLFVIAPWNAVGWLYDEKATVFHICGPKCATQKLNEFMNAQPLADPPAVKKDAAGEPREFEPFIVLRPDNLWYVVKGGQLPDISFATKADADIHLGRWNAIRQGAQPHEPAPATSTQTKRLDERGHIRAEQRADEAPIPEYPYEIETEREQS